MAASLLALVGIVGVSSAVFAYTVPNLPGGARFDAPSMTVCQTTVALNGKRWDVWESGGPAITWPFGTLTSYRSAIRYVVIEQSTNSGTTWSTLDQFTQTTYVGSQFASGPASAQFPAFNRNFTIRTSALIRVKEAYYLYKTNPPTGPAPWYTSAWAFHDDYRSMVWDGVTSKGPNWLNSSPSACALSA
jgi:hypothetical protein